MAEETPFDELIRRVQAGDPDAASELIKRYEPAVRRAVRFRLADARLRKRSGTPRPPTLVVQIRRGASAFVERRRRYRATTVGLSLGRQTREPGNRATGTWRRGRRQGRCLR